MDIKARIEQVINEKGLTKKLVAEHMGKFNQAFNSLLTNPKWNTIESVASAIGISTQEMLYGIKPEAVPVAQLVSAQETSEQQLQADKSPFGDDNDDGQHAQKKQAPEQSRLQSVAAFLCPHCGETIVVGLKK